MPSGCGLPLAVCTLCVVIDTVSGTRSQWVLNACADPKVRFWLAGRPREARAFARSLPIRVDPKPNNLASRNPKPSEERMEFRVQVPALVFVFLLFAVAAPALAE